MAATSSVMSDPGVQKMNDPDNNPNHKIIRVARDQDLIKQIGNDIYFDLVDHSIVRRFRVERQMRFKLFKEEVAREFGIPVKFQRFWKWAMRQNNTYRPYKPLTPAEESKSVGQLREMSFKDVPTLNLFLEVELGLNRSPVPPSVKRKEDVLLFFKLYEPKKEEMRYVGRLFVKRQSKPIDDLRKINTMAGFRLDEEVNLYEEVQYDPSVICDLIDMAASYEENQLDDGDIICFQKPVSQSAENCRYPTVRSFLEHLRSLQEMAEKDRPLDKFTWKIRNFSELTSRKYYSEVFTVADSKWRIVVYPKGNNTDCVSIYLDVADYVSLPIGWIRTVKFSVTVVNQSCRDSSVTKVTAHKFKAGEFDWGFTSFISLTELHDFSNGFLAQDNLIVEVNIFVLESVVIPPHVASNAVPPPSTPLAAHSVQESTDKFISHFDGLDELIGAADITALGEGSSSGAHSSHTVNKAPSSEEVESAGQSLKECLSEPFKLSMKDRLASALSTLCAAETGLSDEQRRSILEFWDNFKYFILSYLTVEHENAEYKVQKLQADLLSSAMKKKRETHLFYKELSEKLAREEEELKKKLEHTRSRNVKLMSDWEVLMAESEETKAKYVSVEAKLTETKKRKRMAEERMSHSTAAWSSLQAQFL